MTTRHRAMLITQMVVVAISRGHKDEIEDGGAKARMDIYYTPVALTH